MASISRDDLLARASKTLGKPTEASRTSYVYIFYMIILLYYILIDT